MIDCNVAAYSGELNTWLDCYTKTCTFGAWCNIVNKMSSLTDYHERV